MAIAPYVASIAASTGSANILKAFGVGTSRRNMLEALGDYWRDYFPDHKVLEALSTGATTLYSTEYGKLLHQVLSSSLLTIPVTKPIKYDLALFRSDNATYTADYISYQVPGWTGVEFFSTSLFESVCTLEKGVHYDVVGDEIRFYVDIFNDTSITSYTYTAEFEGVKCTLLWAMNVLLSEQYIYERFGTYLYSQEDNSEDYKNILIALQYFYTTTKSVARIEATINILFGLPFSRYPGETVMAIDMVNADFALTSAPEAIPAPADTPAPLASAEYYHRVTTDRTVYYSSYFSTLLVAVGQQLNDYELISRFHKVDDYITNPDWMDGARVPYELIVSYNDPDYLAAFSPSGEFADYIPFLTERYDHTVHYDNSRLFVGDTGLSVEGGGAQGNPGGGSLVNLADQAGARRHPLQRIRLSKTATSWKGRLYDLVHTVLSRNIVYFRTQLNFDNYSFYSERLGSLTKIIESGFPVYLYPLMDVVFSASFADTINTVDADWKVTTIQDIQEQYSPGATLPTTYARLVQYNGAILFGGTDNLLRTVCKMSLQEIVPPITEILPLPTAALAFTETHIACTESTNMVVLNKAGQVVSTVSF